MGMPNGTSSGVLYFGAHNTPESFLLFGEWKRQLIETGKAPEVKQIRKDMAHPISSSPHASLMPTAERRPIQYAAIASLAAAVFIRLGPLRTILFFIHPGSNCRWNHTDE